jgi:E3 ubiquitin-protein ligase TRIP12
MVASKLLERRWKTRDLEIHRRKVRDTKSAISRHQSQPFQQNLDQRNAKKEALLERRYTEIERDNRILLEKMSNIMQA